MYLRNFRSRAFLLHCVDGTLLNSSTFPCVGMYIILYVYEYTSLFISPQVLEDILKKHLK